MKKTKEQKKQERFEKLIKSFEDKSDEFLNKTFLNYLILSIVGFMLLFIPFFILNAVGIILLALFAGSCVNVKRLQKYRRSTAQSVHSESQSSVTNYNEKFFDVLPDIYGKNHLKYKYTNDICVFDNSVIEVVYGKGPCDLQIIPEPENPKDSEALAIYYNNTKIGYVYRGQQHDMILDWIKKKQYFQAHIKNVNFETGKIQFLIGFYVPLERYLSKSFSVVRITKTVSEYETSSRMDNMLCMDENDEVIVEYSEIDDAFIVYDGVSEIGELSDSVSSFIDDSENYVALIDELEQNFDRETAKAKVRIYLLDKFDY